MPSIEIVTNQTLRNLAADIATQEVDFDSLAVPSDISLAEEHIHGIYAERHLITAIKRASKKPSIGVVRLDPIPEGAESESYIFRTTHA